MYLRDGICLYMYPFPGRLIMKGLKLWAGIAGIAISAYILVVSGFEAAWNLLTESGHFTGVIGIIIAVLLLAGSIVRIAMRDAADDSGSIISLVLFAVATALAFFISPLYTYMRGWAYMCLIMAIISVVAIMIKNMKKNG